MSWALDTARRLPGFASPANQSQEDLANDLDQSRSGHWRVGEGQFVADEVGWERRNPRSDLLEADFTRRGSAGQSEVLP